MLVGRPSLNAITVVPFAYHMVVKFSMENGAGMVRGDQQVARECYLTSMKQKAVDNIHIDELDMRDELNTQPMPLEDMEPVVHGPDHMYKFTTLLPKDYYLIPSNNVMKLVSLCSLVIVLHKRSFIKSKSFSELF